MEFHLGQGAIVKRAAGVIFSEAEQAGADPAVLGRWQDSRVASGR
jgi:hypothetical protein